RSSAVLHSSVQTLSLHDALPISSPAIWLESKPASKCVMRLMPDLAARTLDQASATVLPIGQTIPNPVTTTRRRLKSTPAVGRNQDRKSTRLNSSHGSISYAVSSF